MLDRLNDVLWVHLGHAYGSAKDVPVLIRSLLAEDADTRSEAIHELFGNIWHQGTVYEATAHAVPFLFEVVEARALPEINEVLVLLALIARGRGYYQVHDPSRTTETEKEARSVASAREAVRSGIPIAIALLHDHDRSVRLTAAHLLAVFADDARSLHALERALASEADAYARTCLGLALACVGKLSDDVFQDSPSCALPVARLRELARMTVAQSVRLDDCLDILLDAAVHELEPGLLDDLGVPELSQR